MFESYHCVLTLSARASIQTLAIYERICALTTPRVQLTIIIYKQKKITFW
jgi:hypothetical protein